MHQFNSPSSSTNQLHQLHQSTEYPQYETDTQLHQLNIGTSTASDTELDLAHITDTPYNTHSPTIQQYAIDAIAGLLYALLLTNYISTARLSASIHTTQTIISLIDPTPNAAYNDKFSSKINRMLMELKLLLGISDVQFEQVKRSVLHNYNRKPQSPSSDASSSHSNTTQRSSTSYTQSQALNAAWTAQHSVPYSYTASSSQVVPYTGTLSSQLRSPLYLSQPHDSPARYDLALRHSGSTSGLDALCAQSQQWQPSNGIVHTIPAPPIPPLRHYAQPFNTASASTINRNYHFSSRNALKSNVRQPKLPTHAQKANGSTYMTEAQFVSYFKNATSLVEAVKSIVRAHPTYREVSIYARARRMELRYDANGILTQGKTFATHRDASSPDMLQPNTSDDTVMQNMQTTHTAIGSLNSIAEDELDLDNVRGDKLSPVAAGKSDAVESGSDGKVSNSTSNTGTTATTAVIDDMTAASTLTSMSPLTSRSNSSSNTSDPPYVQHTRKITKSASHMELRRSSPQRRSSETVHAVEQVRRSSISPCKRKADEMQQ